MKNEYISYKKSVHIANQFRLELLAAGYAALDKHTGVYKHKVPHNVIYIVKSGTGLLTYPDGSEQVLNKNNIYFIPVNTSTYFSCERLKLYYFTFRVNLFTTADLFEVIKPLISIPCPDTLKKSCLTKISGDSNTLDILQIKPVVFSLILNFIDKKELNKVHNYITVFEKYRDIFTYIQNNISRNISIKDLASIANYSTYYLSRKFKEDTGICLKTLLTNKLMEKIKYELLFSDKRIKEITYELGFYDESHFSRFFKKHAQVSPIEYRKQIKDTYYT